MRSILVAFLFVVIVVMGSVGEAAEDTGLGLKLSTGTGRSVFWRGEQVIFSLTRVGDPANVTLTLKPAGVKSLPVKMYEGRLQVHGNTGYLHVVLPTEKLSGDRYVVSAKVGDATVETAFVLRETVTDSPGMVIDDSAGGGISKASHLARQTGYIEFMSSAATGKEYSEPRHVLNNRFDRYMDEQILYWVQDSTRPMSFSPPHSSPDTDGEYLRRMLLMQQVLMRYPASAGQIFDYDPTGYLDKYIHLVSYWRWGKLREDLMAYMKGQEDALRRDFRRETGLEPLTDEEALLLGAVSGVPEAMGYIDLPTRRWAYEIAARRPEISAAKLAGLRRRAFTWYGKLMGLYRERYVNYLRELRDLDATLVHSTANTMGHNIHREGGDRPTAYEPLDFRFISVWDDQGGAPEYIYETIWAATLLNGNRRAGQPLWIDTVWGFLPGNHWRNTIALAGRDAQGTGYSFEMGSSLSYKGRGNRMLAANSPLNQELVMNGQFMRLLGGVLRNARHRPRVGLLYSNRQAVVTPFVPNIQDRIFRVFYLLSHIGQPPQLVTERMLEAGGMPEHIDALVVVGQTEKLPEEAEAALGRFVEAGGRVIADTHTNVPWPFIERSEALDFAFRGLGHPYNMNTAYNRQDASVGIMRELAIERAPKLRALLQDVVQHAPLDTHNVDVGISTLEGGQARFVSVVNDCRLDFSRIFTREQKLKTYYQKLFVGHGEGVIGSWMPLSVNLLLGPKVGPKAAVYDLLDMRRLAPRRLGGGRVIDCDLTDVSGRIYAVYPAPLGVGQFESAESVTAGEAVAFRYQATDEAGGPMKAVVPVEIRLRNRAARIDRAIFRATDAEGRLSGLIPTGAFDPPGGYELLAVQPLAGKGVALRLTLKQGDAPKAAAKSGASVRDAQSIRTFLAEKPELVVPVFDPALRPLAERAVAGLKKQGVKARLWASPPIATYTFGYVVKPEQRPENEKVERGDALGRVLFKNRVTHVNANIYGSAMTGWRYGKHLLLLGVPGKNPVLDGVRESGLLWTDASTDAPGGALVQKLKWALHREKDTLVVTAQDEAGLRAGVEALLNLPESDPVTEGVRQARQKMLRQRALPLNWEPPVPRQPMTARGATQFDTQKEARPSMVVAQSARELGDKIVVNLARWGNSIAVVGADGTVRGIPTVSSHHGFATGKSIVIVPMWQMAFAWTTEGKPLWRAMGRFKAILPGTDSVIIESQKQLYRVEPDGSSAPFEGEPPEPKAATPAYHVTVKSSDRRAQKAKVAKQTPGHYEVRLQIERKGHRYVAESAQIVDTKTGKVAEGIELTPAQIHRRGWDVTEQLLTSADGAALLVFRRDLGSESVQLYNRQRGQVRTLRIDTPYLTDAALTADGRHVLLCGMSGQVVAFDLNGRQVSTAQSGSFPRIFSLPSGRVAVGSSNGRLLLLRRDMQPQRLVDLNSEMDDMSPYAVYRLLRDTKLLAWSNPPVADGSLPLNAFYWYLTDADDELKMVNWKPGKVVDFRWMDAVQGEVAFPETKTYKVTIKAAAKYWDEEPMAQPSWKSIVALRQQVVQGERGAPAFRLYLDGKPVGLIKPEGGELEEFTTPVIEEGWAILKPKPEEFTTFTGEIEIAAGSAMLGIEALHMTDCYMTSLEIE